MKNPDISVITAVYNRETYIERALDSILKQTFDNWEIIVIDDGSTDDTLKILLDYQRRFYNFTVASKRHQNVSASRNDGIELSRGNFITFLDSDDEFLPEHLKLRYKLMMNYPEIDLLHGGVKIIGDEFVADRKNPEKLVPLSQCAIGATFFGKRKVFENLGGFDEISYAEDSNFLEKAERVFKVKKVYYPTYIYHHDTPDSITNKIRLAKKIPL